MKQIPQPSIPMYAVFGRGLDGDLYLVHMDPTAKRDDPGIWKVDSGDFKGESVHANADFYLHTDVWHQMMPLLTPAWHKQHEIVPNSIVTREVYVAFMDKSPMPRAPKNWKLKILECSRSYRSRTISVVVNTSDEKKALKIMLDSNTMLGHGCWHWRSHATLVNHTTQTMKLTFSMTKRENLLLHVRSLLEKYRG